MDILIKNIVYKSFSNVSRGPWKDNVHIPFPEILENKIIIILYGTMQNY